MLATLVCGLASVLRQVGRAGLVPFVGTKVGVLTVLGATRGAKTSPCGPVSKVTLCGTA